MANHVTKNGNGWAFQVAVPKDLLKHFEGRRVIKSSLQTKDRKQAEVAAMRLYAEWSQKFADIRAGRSLAAINQTLSHFGHSIPVGTDPRAAVAAIISDGYARAELARQVVPLLPEILAGLDIELTDEQQRLLAVKIHGDAGERDPLRGRAIALAIVASDAAKSLPPPEKPATPPRPVVIAGGITTLRTLYDEWRGARDVAPSSARECEFAVRRWEELYGTNQPVTDITSDHVGQFIAAIRAFPTNLSNADAALPIAEILKKFDGLPCRRSSPKSVDKRFGFIRTLLNRAQNRRLIQVNPCAGFRIDDTDVATVDVKPFTPEDLRAFFTSPTFLKDAKTKGSNYWLPLVGLFTGARMGEIVQIDAADIRRGEGCEGWVIDIHDGGGRRLKNEDSRRIVPVHIGLWELDFVGWAKSKTGPLFPDLIPEDPEADLSDLASKRMAYRINKAGITSPSKRFHSFRHLAKDRTREAELDEEMRDRLLGHENAKVGRGYGAGFAERKLEAAMRRMSWPVDLSHLRSME